MKLQWKKFVVLFLVALLALSSLSGLADTYTSRSMVKGVQYTLNKAGYDCGEPDGSASKETVAAIKAYQEANGLDATGEIDDALLMFLWETGMDANLAEAIEAVSEGGDIDYTDPFTFVKLYNELVTRIWQFFYGEDKSRSLLADYVLDPDAGSIEENSSVEGEFFWNFENKFHTIKLLCRRNGDDYAIHRSAFTLWEYTNFGEGGVGLIMKLINTAAYDWTVSATLNEGDPARTAADFMALLDKLSFTGYWGGVTIDNWVNNAVYESDRFVMWLMADGLESYDYIAFITKEADKPAEDAVETEAADADDAPEESEEPAEAEPEAEAAEQAKVYTDKATVKAVQQALNDAGYNCGKPDGSAGKKTKAAITQYQADKGLEVTGTVIGELLAALGIQ